MPTVKYRCPSCGFQIFNRRVSTCESCGAALPSELLFSQEQIAALDAEHEKSEKQRRARARSGRGDAAGDSGLWIDFGGGDGGGGD